jgi:hypothetical protein
LIRVETEQTVLAAAVLVVLAMGILFQRLFSGTVGSSPPLRPLEVSPERQDKKMQASPRTNAPLRIFFCAFVTSLALAMFVESRPAPPAT